MQFYIAPTEQMSLIETSRFSIPKGWYYCRCNEGKTHNPEGATHYNAYRNALSPGLNRITERTRVRRNDCLIVILLLGT
jgi:hypothetical protein